MHRKDIGCLAASRNHFPSTAAHGARCHPAGRLCDQLVAAENENQSLVGNNKYRSQCKEWHTNGYLFWRLLDTRSSPIGSPAVTPSRPAFAASAAWASF